MSTTTILQNGIWVTTNRKSLVYQVKEHVVNVKNIGLFDHPSLKLDKICHWKIGRFSEMPENLQKLTGGKTHFNLQMETDKEGYLDGKTILTIPFSGVGIETIQWVSNEEFQTILDSRENWNQASTFYPISSQIGKIVFLSGPPGAGKTTSAFGLAKNHGYVYYEGTVFENLLKKYHFNFGFDLILDA